MAKIRIVNCAEITSPGWRFLQDRVTVQDAELEWSFHSCSTSQNFLERIIRRPRLSRYRACLQAAVEARRARAQHIVTHMPRATLWTAIFCALVRCRSRHLAFSFNFTDLPRGAMRKLMNLSFRRVDRFVVYSTSERELYAEYFCIPRERIDVLPWAMEVPKPVASAPQVPRDYVCAVGGEGRDYATLLEAARHLPHIAFVIVARPHNVKGLFIPGNARVFCDLPIGECWRLIEQCSLSVVPLRDSATNCGHITIVGTMQLGKPLVTTSSRGTSDYVVPGTTALVSEPGDAVQLAGNIKLLWDSPRLRSTLGAQAASRAQRHDLREWVDYLEGYFAQCAAGKTG